MTITVRSDIMPPLVSRRYTVTLQIDRQIRRIIILLFAAAMITGLVSPSACDEFYNDLLRLNGRSYTISSINTGITHDCINSGESAIHHQYRPIVRKSGNDRTDLFRLSDCGLSGSSYSALTNHISLLLLAASTCSAALSYYHIIFIHSQDGCK